MRVPFVLLLLAGCPRGAPPDAVPGVPPVHVPPARPAMPTDIDRHAISVRSEAAADPAWAEHAAWVDDIRRAVDSRWEKELEQTLLWTSLANPVYTTRVAVALDGAGGVASVRVTAPSGITALDEAVVRAVQAGPLSAPPPGLAQGGVVALPELAFSVENGS